MKDRWQKRLRARTQLRLAVAAAPTAPAVPPEWHSGGTAPLRLVKRRQLVPAADDAADYDGSDGCEAFDADA
jgi:hypothetical protein